MCPPTLNVVWSSIPSGSAAECKHLSRMLVTNPALRALIYEILAYPGFSVAFPPRHYLIPFSMSPSVHKTSTPSFVLESDADARAVLAWDRRRGGSLRGLRRSRCMGAPHQRARLRFFPLRLFRRQHSRIPRDTAKKRRFSSFDFYRRKLFATSSSAPTTLTASQSALSLGLTPEDHDPTRGFYLLISAREKIERERVYGTGVFASSQVSVTADEASAAAKVSDKENGAPNSTVRAEKHDSKADYSMSLPRPPIRGTSRFSRISYDAETAPTNGVQVNGAPHANGAGSAASARITPPSPSPTAVAFHPQARAKRAWMLRCRRQALDLCRSGNTSVRKGRRGQAQFCLDKERKREAPGRPSGPNPVVAPVANGTMAPALSLDVDVTPAIEDGVPASVKSKMLAPIPRDFAASPVPPSPNSVTPLPTGEVDREVFESMGNNTLSVRFEIDIVKVPWLPLHRIQFCRAGGDG
ncbi:hypothetical protein C8R44DRAFT_891193 [Mycena epipterygia]|nr:hypothetical protein C8R44DRAFT_891193 [Mycena epipterygia]